MTYGDPGQMPPPGPGGWTTPGAAPGYPPQPAPGFPPAPGYGPPASGYGQPYGQAPLPGYAPGPSWGAQVPPPPPGRSSGKVVLIVALALPTLCAVGGFTAYFALGSTSSELLAGPPIGFADGRPGELAVANHQRGGKTYVRLLKGEKGGATQWKTDHLGFNSYSDVELHAAGPYIVVAGPSTTRAPKVVWLERSSGAVKGEVTLPGTYLSSARDAVQVPPGRTDGTVVVVSRDAVSLVRPGTVVWKGKGTSEARAVHVAGDLLFPGAESDGSVQTVKVADGSPGAKLQPDCADESVSGNRTGMRYRGEAVAQVSGNDMVTVLSDTSRNVCMVRFDGATGEVKQRVRGGGKLGPVSEILVAGDKAVAAGPLGNAAHLDLAANTVTVIENVKGVPAAKLGNVVVLQPDPSGYQAGAAAGIDVATGKTLWTVPVPARQISADETEDQQLVVSGDKVAMVVTRRDVERKNYVKIVSIDPQKGPSLQGGERLLANGTRTKVSPGPAGTALIVADRTLYSVPLEADSTPVKRG